MSGATPQVANNHGDRQRAEITEPKGTNECHEDCRMFRTEEHGHLLSSAEWWHLVYNHTRHLQQPVYPANILPQCVPPYLLPSKGRLSNRPSRNLCTSILWS